MTLRSFLRYKKFPLPVLSFVVLLGFGPACSSDEDGDPVEGSGGVSATGGAGTSPGGNEDGSGGAPATGGGSSRPTEIPTLLSDAGLYEADMQTLAPGVRPFLPRYQLWTDAAVKRRWIWLPEGAQIDTQNADYWSFPAGTRLYKEFVRDGVRVETRLLERQANGAWWMMAYHWRSDQAEADAVPDGLQNASNTDHDIPSAEDCRTCHLRLPDKAIGFSAIQLAHDEEPTDPAAWTLARLQAEGKLSHPLPSGLRVPGDDDTREVLGYIHGNCGHCHNPRSSVSSRVSLNLWLSTEGLATVEGTSIYQSTVGQEVKLAGEGPPGYSLLIDPGAPANSALFLRFDSRGEIYSMPPLGTEVVDPTARTLLESWIASL